MKLFNYELSDWTPHSSQEYPIPNWFRTCSPWERKNGYDFYIGFSQEKRTQIIEEQTWVFYCIAVEPFIETRDLFYRLWDMTARKPIALENLEDAKNQVDSLILKVNTLKVFT